MKTSLDVPYLDLKATYQELQSELDEAVHRVLNSGQYILGPEVQAFEEEFARYEEVSWAAGVSNGTDGLHFLCRALNLGQGDEVIIPVNTYFATFLSVSMAGAKPVPVDVDEKTYNLCVRDLEKSVTSKTRAMIAVHLYGQPADMGPLLDFASKENLHVMEDASHADGARYHGRRVGVFGAGAVFSFYPVKNLGAFGDAGIVTTSHKTIDDRIRVLRNYGSSEKYALREKGFNGRMDPLQAAMLRVKLKWLDCWNDRRKQIAQIYLERLAEVPEIVLPFVPANMDPVWHVFAIQTERRKEFQEYLSQEGIQTLIHFPIPVHLQKAYEDLGYARGSFPVAEWLAERLVSLPMGPHLSTEQIEYTCEKISEFFRR